MELVVSSHLVSAVAERKFCGPDVRRGCMFWVLFGLILFVKLSLAKNSLEESLFRPESQDISYSIKLSGLYLSLSRTSFGDEIFCGAFTHSLYKGDFDLDTALCRCFRNCAPMSDSVSSLLNFKAGPWWDLRLFVGSVPPNEWLPVTVCLHGTYICWWWSFEIIQYISHPVKDRERTHHISLYTFRVLEATNYY